MKNTGTPFLVRPRPLPGETSSSFRQRAGWANGYAIFPVLDERTRRSDPDVGASCDDNKWLATLHGVTSDQIVSMTLRSLIGRVVPDLSLRSQPIWWLRTRMGSATAACGPMFCPLCLSEDDIPYYRLSWRLAFITHCEKHQTRLLDRCPRCDCAPWPAGCGVPKGVHQDFATFKNCWRCGFRYERSSGCAATLRRAEPLDWYRQSMVTLGSLQAPTIEALQAVRAIGQLFLRNRSRSVIQRSGSRWIAVIDALSAPASRTQMIEYLGVEDRSVLVPVAAKLLQNWPTDFLSFCKDAGVTRAHFNGAEQLCPPWMKAVIDEYMAVQNRNITPEILRQTVVELQMKLGHKPTVTSLRSHLNWQGENGLNEIYPLKRRTATDGEWLAFVEACACALHSAELRGMRSRMAVLTDLIAILDGLMTSLGLQFSKTPNRTSIVTGLKKARDCQILEGSTLADLIDRLLQKLEADLSRSRRDLSLEVVSDRQTKKRLKALMCTQPDDLERMVQVFVEPARKQGLRKTESTEDLASVSKS